MKYIIFVFALLSLTFPTLSYAEVKEYEINIDYKTVNYSGKSIKAMSINGSIPGPTLKFKVGDIAKIHVKNSMDVDTSVHWHGVLLPNREDGVPYLTTPPIKPGTTYTYEFPIKHSGTYWYHSHSGLQEQRGVYGSLVFESVEPRIDIKKVDEEYVLVLSDWTNENPHEILRTLKRGSEYNNFKKGTIQTAWGVIKNKALKENIKRSFIRMPPMDIADIAYDSFLINGKQNSKLENTSDKTIKLRIINAAASTYFYLNYAGGNMKIIAADGVDVESVEIDKLLIAVAETYDLIVKVPESGAYEFRATAQDNSGHASLFLGSGKEIKALDIPKINLYKMDHGTHRNRSNLHSNKEHKMDVKNIKKLQKNNFDELNKENSDHYIHNNNKNTGHQKHHVMKNEIHSDHVEMGHRPTTPYKMLKATKSTALPDEYETKEFVLNLTGNMERFVWSINGKTLDEADKIRIKKGENVRFILVNQTMMHHPMHLHGHFFRVLNDHGDYSPLKHTVDVPPLGKIVMEFEANEEKDWFFHCHVLYHMMSGMARVISYEDSEIDSDILKMRKYFKHDPIFYWLNAQVLSQMSEGEIIVSNTRNIISTDWEVGWKDEEYEIDIFYNRYVNRFFSPFIGVQITNEEQKTRGVAGFSYLLPFLVDSKVWVDWEGDFRFMLEKEMQLTKHIGIIGEVEFDTESKWEGEVSLSYIINKQLSIVGKFHSEFGVGGGLEIRL